MKQIRRGDRAYVVAIRLRGRTTAWIKNIRADPNVSLRIRGGTFAGRARELSGQVESEEAMAAYCETLVAFDYLGYAPARKGTPDSFEDQGAAPHVARGRQPLGGRVLIRPVQQRLSATAQARSTRTYARR